MGISACQPQATPFPANIPSPTAENIITPTLMPIRYAVPDNALPYFQFHINAPIDVITTTSSMTLGDDYDIIADYGLHSGWTASPISQHVALVLNLQQSPLDNPVIADLIRSIPDSTTLTDLSSIIGVISAERPTRSAREARIALANSGYLDGLELRLAMSPMPGIDNVIQQFQSANIFLNPVSYPYPLDPLLLSSEGYPLALVLWTQATEREQWLSIVGEANWIALYTLPISYQAIPELSVQIADSGWPIASR